MEQPKTGGTTYAKNKVPEYQRIYQKAYASHVRVWNIHPRSRWLMRPYLVLLYGTMSATAYMAGRKILGHNTWFGKD